MQANRQTESALAPEVDDTAPPIYTVPRDSLEYEERRNEEHERGLETFLEAIVLFGGALIFYFFITWVF